MEDSPQHHQFESANLHVKGMESVVATVTGYHGSERFNLIKLISHAGASYVGNMTPSVTHLACWEFEGRKYELAKKLKIVIVNHRWIEECVKKGRRVPEGTYTFQSGKEVGPLKLAPPSKINMAKIESEALKKSKQLVVDIDCDNTNNAPWLEETGPSERAISSRVKKRNSTSQKSQGKARRLVKNHKSKKGELFSSNMLEELDEREALTRNTSSVNLFDSSNSERQDHTDSPDDVEEVQHANNENRNSNAHSSISSPQPISEKFPETACVDSMDAVERVSTQNGPSCIICLEGFSPIRGVLSCGHRFCFHCIQSWSDYTSLKGKPSTCPLCKASFTCIMKDAVSSDQKIYSQSIPQGTLENLYVLPELGYVPYALPSNASAQVCCECSSREPEDLLVKCHSCGIRCVHCYCLDPPLFPWTCVACNGSSMIHFIHGR